MPRSDHLRVGEHVGDAVDRPGRHAGRLERCEQIVARHVPRQRRKCAGQRRRGCATRAALVRKRCVRGKLRRARGLAQKRANCAVVADGDDDVAVRDREDLVGHDVRVGVAHAARGGLPETR